MIERELPLDPPETDRELTEEYRSIERDAVRQLIDAIELEWDEEDRVYTMAHIEAILDDYKTEYGI